MHAAAGRSPQRVGCHHGKVAAEAAPPMDDGACAMRSACGHRGHAVVAAFEAELPLAIVVSTPIAAPFVSVPERPLVIADGPAPPDHPPESLVV